MRCQRLKNKTNDKDSKNKTTKQQNKNEQKKNHWKTPKKQKTKTKIRKINVGVEFVNGLLPFLLYDFIVLVYWKHTSPTSRQHMTMFDNDPWQQYTNRNRDRNIISFLIIWLYCAFVLQTTFRTCRRTPAFRWMSWITNRHCLTLIQIPRVPRRDRYGVEE